MFTDKERGDILMCARAAKASYNFERVDDYEIIEVIELKNGLDCCIYYNERTYIVAFAGTEFEINDILTDVSQFLGYVGEQYSSLMQILDIAQNYLGEIFVTGHSLGGGLASLFGTKNKLKTYTFNPAGIHTNTLVKYGISRQDSKKCVTAFTVKGDLLDIVNDWSMQPLGLNVELKYSNFLLRLLNIFKTPIKRHTINEVINLLTNGGLQ